MNERNSAIADIFRLNLKIVSEADPYSGEQETYEWLVDEVLTLAKCDKDARDYIDKAIDALMDLMNERLDDNDTEAVELINELVDSYEYYLDKYCPKLEVEEG